MLGSALTTAGVAPSVLHLCCLHDFFALQLVIFESNPIARAALYYYLRRLGLAMEVKTNLLYAQDSLLSNRASSNTPADWAERGISLMQQQVSGQAAHSNHSVTLSLADHGLDRL